MRGGSHLQCSQLHQSCSILESDSIVSLATSLQEKLVHVVRQGCDETVLGDMDRIPSCKDEAPFAIYVIERCQTRSYRADFPSLALTKQSWLNGGGVQNGETEAEGLHEHLPLRYQLRTSKALRLSNLWCIQAQQVDSDH